MVKIALTYIYGIGQPGALTIRDNATVRTEGKVREVSEGETMSMQRVIQERCMVERELRKKTQLDIKRLVEVGSYRCPRHRKSLPVRGQRTHTNARTRKGPRRTTMKKNKPPAGSR